ncbi:MAG: thioesterase family protein [Pseudomonadales bacterium]|nr:thioesterase family protein [Pseudomonadales bacterium]MCP5182937.1 thioesterase family protein [Pseudomonadales bacterium]
MAEQRSVQVDDEAAGKARAERLLELLSLEVVEQDLFLGSNETRSPVRLFGGQVLAQSLRAACMTVAGGSGQKPHSLHGYFMRAGDASRRVLYEVERIRDGRSFATRRVVAIQGGEAIFNLDVSFQVEEKGFEHADPIPNVPRPEALEDDLDHVRRLVSKGLWDPRLSPMAGRARPFAMRSVFVPGSEEWGRDRSWNPVWIRFLAKVDAADQALARSLLAYASDMGFVGTAAMPHHSEVPRSELQMASLDHAIWIHRDIDPGEWLLFHRMTTWADAARGMCHAQFFNRRGELVASVTQEGLLRRTRD